MQLLIYVLLNLLTLSNNKNMEYKAMKDKRPQVKILKDFVTDYPYGKLMNTSNSSANQSERCGKVKLPGIFLHPVNRGDAIIEFSAHIQDNNFLLFRIGMRDGIPWGSKQNTPNGARFLVYINGHKVFSEDISKSVWKSRVIDMRPWAGKDVTIQFRTNSIEGNSNYDWCVFGQPMLVEFIGTYDYSSLAENTVGVALAEISCEEPSEVSLSMGNISESISINPGKHLLTLHFNQIQPVNFAIIKGKAELLSVALAPYLAKLEMVDLNLDSPLVNVDKSFKVLLKLKNTGLGIYNDEDLAYLNIQGNPVGEGISIGEIQPGKEKTIIWEDLKISKPGDYEFTASIFDDVSSLLKFHVFPSDGEVKAAVSNKWSHLEFYADNGGESYAIAKTWDGESWKTLGAIYPLGEIILMGKQGKPEVLKLKISSFIKTENQLKVLAQAKSSGDQSFMITITYIPEVNSPLVYIQHELVSDQDTKLLAFYGTSLLAGHGVFGVKKDFAIFPGLEYLEGDEESSSERDLAYPLNKREVPARHKITTPLMAVQAQASLLGLMWSPNNNLISPRFFAPKFDSGYSYINMSLFAPSVGEYVTENEYFASKPYTLIKGEKLSMDSYIILDHKSNYTSDSVVYGPHKGGLVLKSMQHWFDVYGMPEPSKQPRDWQSERELCRDAYFNAVWSDDPVGWRHCHGWAPGLFVGHAVPLILDMKAGVKPEIREEIERRIDLVVNKAIERYGKGYLWTNAACHIILGELPFYYGYLGEALKSFRDSAYQRLSGRENGLWVWRPQDKEHESLGKTGDHTLGQAALNSLFVLRSARLSGDKELIKQALEAMKQMELYEVPRGAQMWECPMYQPDILAAGYAIRAYCEAYRLTGDQGYLEHARYWGMTGLPFLYMWSMDGYPTMLYNVIAVIGSTFYTHSWLGLPVVWCGLVYAYGLLDLAEFDNYFDWSKIAQGIVNSTMWQQYTDGPSKGCYPDSWNMIRNKPNPADINPENILVNEFRLRGQSPEPRCFRFEGKDGFAYLNSGGDIINPSGHIDQGRISFHISGTPGFQVFSILAPVKEPARINGKGQTVENSSELQKLSNGWIYDHDLKGIIIKSYIKDSPLEYVVEW